MATAMRTAKLVAREIEARTKPTPKAEKATAAAKAVAARVKTAKTTVTAYVEEELSLRAIECLPEMLQVRAKLDKKWCKQYAEDRAAGATFPPIIIFRLPCGRLVVTDGYHRVDAWKALGLKTIRCQVREGTMQDALLAAIEANTAEFHRGRPFSEDDRTHAVEMMIEDPELRLWSDRRIGRQCGTSTSTVGKFRTKLSIEKGIPVPDYVIDSNGRKVRYRRPRGGTPTITICSKGTRTTTIDGKRFYLGTNDAVAGSRLSDIATQSASKRISISKSSTRYYLSTKGFIFNPVNHSLGVHGGLHGSAGHGVIFTCAHFDQSDTPQWTYGCLHGLRELAGMPDARLVCLCVPEDAPPALLDLYRKLGIEFLSPEAFADSLKGS